MSSLDFDLDLRMSSLEQEWRQAYEASMLAHADFQSLTTNAAASTELLDKARQRLERSEAVKSRIMNKIERLESILLDQG